MFNKQHHRGLQTFVRIVLNHWVLKAHKDIEGAQEAKGDSRFAYAERKYSFLESRIYSPTQVLYLQGQSHSLHRSYTSKHRTIPIYLPKSYLHFHPSQSPTLSLEADALPHNHNSSQRHYNSN